MNKLDPRLVRISLIVDGKIKTYDQLAISASGTKYGNSLQNECEITIDNLDKATQDYILTQTSPYLANRTPKTVILEAGRESYGYTKIYQGNIIVSSVGQPPDISVRLKCMTGNFLKGSILSRTYSGAATTEQIHSQISNDIGLTPVFQATSKNVGNYSYAGSNLKQVDQLAEIGGPNTNVFVDDDSLIMKNAFTPLRGSTRTLNADNGMIGIPVFTEQGLRVKYLLDNVSRLGGGLQIHSSVYPAANGTFVIYKLSFEITNRDIPFYYIAECARVRGAR